jgi:uncharacterized protein (TIGR00288 family)
MNDSNGSRVTVLIDYENALNLFRENVPRGQVDWEQVVRTARCYGSVLICKAYADWEGNKTVRERIMRLGIEPVTVPKSKTGKNGVDVKIAVDAIDMLVLKNTDIRTVVLVSGDGDFTPLVNYLKDHGKYVVGMGIRGSTAEFLDSACHEFKYLEKDNRAPDPIQDHPLIRKDPQPEATETVRAPKAEAPPAATAPGSGNGTEALVQEYLQILRKNGVPIEPSENRHFIIKKCFWRLKGHKGKPFSEFKEKITDYFEKNRPGIDKAHVHHSLQQILKASCLLFENPLGDAVPSEQEMEAKASLKDRICTPQAFMGSIDRFIVEIIRAETASREIDAEALATVLYGTSQKPELVRMAMRLIGEPDHRTATG